MGTLRPFFFYWLSRSVTRYDFGVLCIDRGHVAGGILAGKGVCMGVPLVINVQQFFGEGFDEVAVLF